MHEIYRVGHNNSHGADFMAYRPNGFGQGCYLMLFVRTKACFTINGIDQITEPDTFILYGRSCEHAYRACGEIYTNDWMQFGTDDEIIEKLNIPLNIPIHIGETPELTSYFKLIEEAFLGQAAHKEYICAQLLGALLYQVADFVNQKTSDNRYYSKLLDIRKDIFQHPERDWSVQSLCNTFHLSKSYFQGLYRSTFGTSIGADIISSRISKASDLLLSSDFQIGEIAAICGYNSVVHFTRQFKQQTFLSPSEYRKTMHKDSSGVG